jgi:hypothetical protein
LILAERLDSGVLFEVEIHRRKILLTCIIMGLCLCLSRGMPALPTHDRDMRFRGAVGVTLLWSFPPPPRRAISRQRPNGLLMERLSIRICHKCKTHASSALTHVGIQTWNSHVPAPQNASLGYLRGVPCGITNIPRPCGFHAGRTS